MPLPLSPLNRALDRQPLPCRRELGRRARYFSPFAFPDPFWGDRRRGLALTTEDKKSSVKDIQGANGFCPRLWKESTLEKVKLGLQLWVTFSPCGHSCHRAS